MRFSVTVSSRKVGALGLFDHGQEEVEAATTQEAADKVREKLYAEGREHVHVGAVFLAAGAPR